jgi:hypothetical protein
MARGGRHQTHELVAPDDVAKAVKTALQAFNIPKPRAAQDSEDHRHQQKRETRGRALRAAGMW